ncbi:hypothetical protein PR048_027561 [Dryococelus australis]|uniref:Uncharacterized protein n=1 Tax=Dryococelus australis TaxID=614101 RepID=A0ABQ9GGW2_9NEOP|nr:hypothetical protein PR048_027561 [Dryococelus australis]
MEQRRNAREGETGDLRENPPTSGIVRHDSHMQKSGGGGPGRESNPGHVKTLVYDTPVNIRVELEARFRAAFETIKNTTRRPSSAMCPATCCSAAEHASNAEKTILRGFYTLSCGAASECRDGGTGEPRVNPSTSGIVRHDPHMRKSGSDPPAGLPPRRIGFSPRPGHSRDFRKRESYRTTLLIGDFLSGISRACIPALLSPHFTLIGSQDLVWRSRAPHECGGVSHHDEQIWLLLVKHYRLIRHAFRRLRFLSQPPRRTGFKPRPGHRDFRKWESCRTMPSVGGFSRGSPVSPAPSFRHRYIFTSITLIGSQDLAVKSRPNLLIHSIPTYTLDSFFFFPETSLVGFHVLSSVHTTNTPPAVVSQSPIIVRPFHQCHG